MHYEFSDPASRQISKQLTITEVVHLIRLTLYRCDKLIEDQAIRVGIGKLLDIDEMVARAR